ncbi:MAG: hypothetical protein WCO82_06120 [Sphingomonadales bacterium]
MKNWVRTVAAGALLLSAADALAAPSALIRCDGHGRRQTPGEQVGRGILVLGTLGLFGSAEADNPAARETGEAGIKACTDAMADSRVTGNPIRKAEVFLARGIRQLEMGHLAEALADADAGLAVGMEPVVRAQFDRTLGPSLILLKAYVKVAQGQQAEAESLALQAATPRPWGVLMAEEATRVMAVTPAISPEEAGLLARLFRLRPDVRRAQALEAAGDWPAAAKDIAQVIGVLEEPSPVIKARHAAVLALAGDNAGAKTLLDATAQQVDELAAKASGTDDAAQRAAQSVARADELMQLAKAQLALNAGSIDEAKGLLAGRSRWLANSSIAAAVVANVQAKGGAAAVPGVDPAKLRADAIKVVKDGMTGKNFIESIMRALPRWENADVPEDFGKDMTPPSKAMLPKPIRDGKATRITSNRDAAIDTGIEAMIVAMARTAASRNVDRFAVLTNFSGSFGGREGIVSSYVIGDFVMPGDALFAAQESRAIKVADVEAALGAAYTAPPPVKR